MVRDGSLKVRKNPRKVERRDGGTDRRRNVDSKGNMKRGGEGW